MQSFSYDKAKKPGSMHCRAVNGGKNIEYNPKHEESWRPDFCPLRELPEQEHNDNEYDEYSDGWDAGWNACLGEITR